MTLWRVSNYRLIDGQGGLVASGRWHTKGRRVVYTAQNVALALLEMLVHMEIEVEDQPVGFRTLEIEVPEGLMLEVANPQGDWRKNIEKTRSIGDDWLQSMRTPLLQVPSAIAPDSSNFLINPLHPDATGIRVIRATRHPLDPRLIR